MTVVLMWKWVVKQGKHEQHKQLMHRFQEFVRNSPKLFKELKSMRFLTQTFGGISGAYVELAEFESLADLAACLARTSKDEEYRKIDEEWMSLLDPTTFKASLFTAVS